MMPGPRTVSNSSEVLMAWNALTGSVGEPPARGFGRFFKERLVISLPPAYPPTYQSLTKYSDGDAADTTGRENDHGSESNHRIKHCSSRTACGLLYAFRARARRQITGCA